ncbi:MAG: flagellar hook-associated protein FlgL [uncultured bacterium]|nr:MAG: flagellar hook-associated protein FlgL [uncultured bacterium]HBH17820.1 flagellar hook-associated protein 3 [Cyanobacteria bacterium UBA9579]
MILTRVTNRSMSDVIINNLLTNRSKLYELQEQISSGKLVTKPSQNPTSAMSILSDRSSLFQIDNYVKNIKQAESELEITDKAILSAVDVIHRARELTVQASNLSSGPNELAAINFEIEQLINTVKDLGNTKFGGKYIYGGLVTEDAPFQTVGTDQIQYMGTPSAGNYQRQVEITKGVTIDLNLAGDAIFGQYYESAPGPPPVMTGSGLIQTLTTLSQELEAVPTNYENIRTKIDDLETDLHTLLNAQAQIGGTLSRLEMTKNKLEEDNISYTKRKSSLEDVDLAKAISDVQFQETALQSSLSVSAKVVQFSLLDYIS